MHFGFLVFGSKTRPFSWFCLSLHIQFGHKPWTDCLSLHIWNCWDIISVRVIYASSPLQSVGAPAIDQVWALPLCSTLGCSLGLFEFGRSRLRVWPLPPSLGALRWRWPVFKCTCVLGWQHYQTPWILCSASGSDTRAWFNKKCSTTLFLQEW